MKLYFVRHGQTLFNLKHRVQGWCDSPLTQEGIKQSMAVGKGLEDVEFCAAYCSTSERAIDTANYIIGDRKIPLTPLKGLKEMNFGTFEGEYEADVLAKDGSSHDFGFLEAGGETFPLTTKRMVNTIERIAHKHTDDILIVSHGISIMCTLLGLSQLKVHAFRNGGYYLDNCCVSIVNYDGEFILETIGDTSFRDKGWKGE